MEAVWTPPKFMHIIYDLKGSSVGRSASEKDYKQMPKECSTSTVLKDNDLKESKRLFHVGKKAVKLLKKRLQLDVDFLVKLGVLDYSFLVGINIADIEDTEISAKDVGNVIESIDGREIYFMGIIDYLVPYSLQKRGEYLLKSKVQGLGSAMSVLPPEEYGKRFMEFICSTFSSKADTYVVNNI
mmetsp:Transcript_13685/g.20647  ORF Transcript_13685/g.20647 Transcript_13685/m.20647 type:complete len:184 (+) Transcript_13685:38-589(+)